jgi:hypothetical protein
VSVAHKVRAAAAADLHDHASLLTLSVPTHPALAQLLARVAGAFKWPVLCVEKGCQNGGGPSMLPSCYRGLHGRGTLELASCPVAPMSSQHITSQHTTFRWGAPRPQTLPFSLLAPHLLHMRTVLAGVRKTRLERAGQPAFRHLVEVLGRGRFRVHRNLAASVDALLLEQGVVEEDEWEVV